MAEWLKVKALRLSPSTANKKKKKKKIISSSNLANVQLA
jgi:hypothetical protein